MRKSEPRRLCDVPYRLGVVTSPRGRGGRPRWRSGAHWRHRDAQCRRPGRASCGRSRRGSLHHVLDVHAGIITGSLRSSCERWRSGRSRAAQPRGAGRHFEIHVTRQGSSRSSRYCRSPGSRGSTAAIIAQLCLGLGGRERPGEAARWRAPSSDLGRGKVSDDKACTLPGQRAAAMAALS